MSHGHRGSRRDRAGARAGARPGDVRSGSSGPRRGAAGTARGRSRGFLEWLPLLLVLGATALAYAPLRDAQFLQWDDVKTIASNPDLNPPSARGVLRYWNPARPYMDLYVPVTYTVWAAVASVAATAPSPGTRARLDPAAFHIASLVLHLLAVAMAFLILRVVLDAHRLSDASPREAAPDGARAPPRPAAVKLETVAWAAALGAGVFALHPLQVETVAWASGLKDVLAGALVLTALWLYLRFVAALRETASTATVPGSAESGDAAPAPASRRTEASPPHERGVLARPAASRLVLFLLATVAFVLAMLSKPSAVVAPLLAACLVLALPWNPRPEPGAPQSPRSPGSGARATLAAARSALAPLLLWLLLAVPVMLVARRSQPAATGFASPLWARPLVALDALAFYAAKLVAPVRLAMDYSRSPDWLVTTHWIWWTWTIPAAIALAVLFARRRAPWLPPAALFPVAALLPVLGLVRFDYQSHSTVADHYVYVALLGPALALALLLSRRPVTQSLVVGALLLTPLAALTRIQVAVWHDTNALFTHTLAVNPRSLAANINIGHQLFVQGRTEEAMRHIDAALATRPDEPEAHNNLGNALLRLKRPREAAEHYRIALAADPANPTGHFNLGLALAALGDPEGAAREYDEALRLNPDYAAALTNRAELYLNTGDYDRAVALYRRAIAADPDLAPARRGLSNALAGQAGRTVPPGVSVEDSADR